MPSGVRLVRLDAETLPRLLEVAVAEADPHEVMPPVPGPPGWTAARRRAFLEFFEPMLPGEETTLFAIVADGRMAGFMRLKLLADPGVAETGMWVGRSWRGRGVGTAALDELLAEAARRGITKVVADTTEANAAALAVLRRSGADLRPDTHKVFASLKVR